MTLVIPQDFAAVIHSLIWAGDPEPMAMTYGVGIDTASPPASPGALAHDLQVAFNTFLVGLFPNDISTSQCEVRWQDSAPPTPPVIGTDTTSAVGTRTGDLIPQNGAFLIHKRSASGGRGGRGRMYAPGIQATVVDDLGNLTSGEITNWNTGLATLLGDIRGVAGVDSMVILHESTGAFAASPPVPITSMNVDAVMATQRRRLRR